MILTRVISKLPADNYVSLRESGPLETARESSRAKSRKRWIIQTGLLLTVSAAILIVLVVFRRDQATVQSILKSMAPDVQALQATVQQLDQLPAYWTPASRMRIAYVAEAALVRDYARHSHDAVIVAHSLGTPLILHEDGCGVILYEQGKLRAEWWTLREFIGRKRAQDKQIEAYEERLRNQPVELP